MNKFKQQFRVNYYEINTYREATPNTILNYLEEAAVSHSESVGYGIDSLLERNLGWVLNRWHLIMERYPIWGENIIIETWPSNFQRFYATRQFFIKDNDNNILGRASSLWIFLDIVKKRPKRIPTEFGDAYGMDPLRAMDDPFSDFSFLDNPTYNKEFQIRKSDIDTNNHVNNGKYVDWILETIPLDLYNTHSLYELEVVYKNEIKYGESINASCDNYKDGFIHYISKADESSEVAMGKTTWKKR